MAACGSCGKENPYNSSFCPFCGKLMPGAVPRTGTALQSAAPAAAPPAAAPPAPTPAPRPAPAPPPAAAPMPAPAAAQDAQKLAQALAREESSGSGARAVVTDTPPQGTRVPTSAAGAAAAAMPVRSVSSVFISAKDLQNQMSNRVVVPPPAAAPPTACPVCKAAVTATTRFCSQCGTRLDPNAPVAPAAKAAAAIKQTQFLSAFKVADALKNKNRLVLMDADGHEGMQFSIAAAQTMCGRMHGLIVLDDPYVSPAHCVFRFLDGVLSVEDAGSLNGVFIKLRGDVGLSPGDEFRAGKHLVRVAAVDSLSVPLPQKADDDDARPVGTPVDKAPPLRLVEILDGGTVGDSRLMRTNSMTFGRAGCDFVLTDESVSARHCEISMMAGLAVLRDLGSTNGTFVRLREEQRLENGDVLLVGQHRIRVDIRA